MTWSLPTWRTVSSCIYLCRNFIFATGSFGSSFSNQSQNCYWPMKQPLKKGKQGFYSPDSPPEKQVHAYERRKHNQYALSFLSKDSHAMLGSGEVMGRIISLLFQVGSNAPITDRFKEAFLYDILASILFSCRSSSPLFWCCWGSFCPHVIFKCKLSLHNQHVEILHATPGVTYPKGSKKHGNIWIMSGRVALPFLISCSSKFSLPFLAFSPSHIA